MSKSLSGRVAIVAGATRGAGRGIAVALGEAGATVYCTGRSVKGKPATGNRTETIEETAGLVTRAGGKGIPARCDHTLEADVSSLMAAVKTRYGHLDILVNDVWGEIPLLSGASGCGRFPTPMSGPLLSEQS